MFSKDDGTVAYVQYVLPHKRPSGSSRFDRVVCYYDGLLTVCLQCYIFFLFWNLSTNSIGTDILVLSCQKLWHQGQRYVEFWVFLLEESNILSRKYAYLQLITFGTSPHRVIQIRLRRGEATRQPNGRFGYSPLNYMIRMWRFVKQQSRFSRRLATRLIASNMWWNVGLHWTILERLERHCCCDFCQRLLDTTILMSSTISTVRWTTGFT